MPAEAAQKALNQHLDSCAQCREHPFGICRTGFALLKAAAAALTAPLVLVPPYPPKGEEP